MPSAALELGLLALAVVGLLVRARQAGHGQAGYWHAGRRRAGFRLAGSGRAGNGYGRAGKGYGRAGNGYGRAGNGYGRAGNGYGRAGNLFPFAQLAAHDDAWASVAWAYSSQPDGWLPIGVVRVYNPDAAPVVVSVSVGTDPGFFARFSLLQRGRSLLSVRALRVGRQLRPAKEPLLGVVNGGATGCWEVPLGSATHSLVVKVRLDQAALRSRLFTWRLRPCAIPQAWTPARDLVRR